MSIVKEGLQLKAVHTAAPACVSYVVGNRSVESIVVSMEPAIGGQIAVAVVRFNDGSPPRMVNLTLAEEWELTE